MKDHFTKTRKSKKDSKVKEIMKTFIAKTPLSYLAMGPLLIMAIRESWKSTQEYEPYDQEKKRQDELRIKLGKPVH